MKKRRKGWPARRIHRERAVQASSEPVSISQPPGPAIRSGSAKIMISRITIKLSGSIPIIQALVALCPLMGLMGTVTGMIEVFDVCGMFFRHTYSSSLIVTL